MTMLYFFMTKSTLSPTSLANPHPWMRLSLSDIAIIVDSKPFVCSSKMLLVVPIQNQTLTERYCVQTSDLSCSPGVFFQKTNWEI